MTEKKNKKEIIEILKRLGVSFHVLGLLLSIIVIIVVIVLATPFLLIWIPIYLVGGWGLRWILTGETSNIIPFYEDQKSFVKRRFPNLYKRLASLYQRIVGLIDRVFPNLVSKFDKIFSSSRNKTRK
tara:strand:+ start:59 stop:439 length:381 start_codon:yes stop_codon:yes gene_type:complete